MSLATDIYKPNGFAAGFGFGGLLNVDVAKNAANVMKLWWLTRPSDLGANACGPIPAVKDI
ncbi:MAG: hypothetical protein ACPGNV_00740 [Mangrovicoccus sp.]